MNAHGVGFKSPRWPRFTASWTALTGATETNRTQNENEEKRTRGCFMNLHAALDNSQFTRTTCPPAH